MGCGASSSVQPENNNLGVVEYEEYDGYGTDYTNYQYYQKYFDTYEQHPSTEKLSEVTYNPQEAWNEYCRQQQYQKSLTPAQPGNVEPLMEIQIIVLVRGAA